MNRGPLGDRLGAFPFEPFQIFVHISTRKIHFLSGIWNLKFFQSLDTVWTFIFDDSEILALATWGILIKNPTTTWSCGSIELQYGNSKHRASGVYPTYVIRFFALNRIEHAKRSISFWVSSMTHRQRGSIPSEWNITSGNEFDGKSSRMIYWYPAISTI